MPYGPDTLASDGDREQIAARLRDAHADGRLTGEEFYSRLDALYAARTYGELEPLVRDIPAATTYRTPEIVAEPAARPVRRRSRGTAAMRVLWTILLAAFMINVVIWLIVSVTTGQLQYFWPIWVGGPAGAVLLSVELMRRRH